MDKRRYWHDNFLECVAADVSLPLLPPRHFVVHSWEMSASDMFLGVAEFANRGELAPSTREDVLHVSWHEENCPLNLDATFPSDGAFCGFVLSAPCRQP